MKFLSVRQPWAYAIIYLGKGVENRSRNTSHRGALGIHASQTFDDEGAEWLRAQGYDLPPIDEMPRGGLVGIARLINVVHERDRHLITAADREWFFGPYGYMLDSQEPCEFVPWRGVLGFFEVPDEHVRKPVINSEISDCGTEGCGECDVCRYLAFLEECQQVASDVESTIERSAVIEAHLDEHHPHWRGGSA